MAATSRNEKTLIRALPSSIRSIVRSGITISTVSDCVEELVYNSIDAGAKNINIGVNLDQFNIRVDDDGGGLSEVDLESVGVRYSTSKCHCLDDLKNLEYYGFRGEALASIVDVSAIVNIVSRPKAVAGVELRKKFENGKVSGFIEKHNTTNKNPGTTVIIANLLVKVPVRQKRIDKSIQLEEVKRALERISLINPSLNVELRDEKTGKLIIGYKTSTCYSDAFDQLYRSCIGFDVNFVAEHFRFQNLFFTLSISKDYFKKKYYQFVFLNNRYIRRCRIHKWVGKYVLEGTGTPTGTKCERYPIFILNIACPFDEYDATVEPKKESVGFKNWEDVQNGIEGLILKYRTKHHSIPGKSKAEAVDKNQSNLSSYDVKGALHSRFVARSISESSIAHEFGSISRLSEQDSIVKTHISISGEKRDLQFTNRNLTRTGSNSRVVNAKEIRKKRSVSSRSLDVESKMCPDVKNKRPRLTLGAFERFPEWKEQFDNNASSNELQSLKGCGKLNLTNQQQHGKHDRKNENPSSSNSLENFPRKSNQEKNFIQLQEKETERKRNEAETAKTEMVDVVNKLQEEIIHLASNTSDSSRSGSCKTSKSLQCHSIKSASKSFTEISTEYMERVLSSDWKMEHKGSAIVDKIFKYTGKIRKEGGERMDTSASMFKPKISTESHFRKPRNPFSVQTKQIASDKRLDMKANHSEVEVKPSNSFLEVMNDDTTNSAYVPPLLNFLPLQKCFSSDWNDNMIDVDYVEPDTELFPTDWSAEIIMDHSNQEWLKTTDTFGKLLYINMNTGSSSYDMIHVFGSSRRVTAEEIKKFYPSKYNWLKKHFPKGYTQFLNGAAREIVKEGDPSKLKDSIIGDSLQKFMNKTTEQEVSIKWMDNKLPAVSEYFKDANMTIHTLNNLTSSADIKCWKQVSGSMNSFRFKREDMDHARVIGQWDKKFIIAVIRTSFNGNGMLVIFDQHAVHERIRLEKFVAESYINPKAAKKYLVYLEVMPPYQLNLSDTEVRIMQSYEDLLEQIGVKFQPISSTCVKIKTAPKCFCEKSATEPLSSREEVLRTLIHDLIKEQIHQIIETKGTGFTGLPKTIFNVLCSQACHGAIKFGDELDYDTCCHLICDLKKCKTLFQCAHGRPSVVPMINLGNEKTKLNWTDTFPHAPHVPAPVTSHNNLLSCEHSKCSEYFCGARSSTSSGYFSCGDTSFNITKAPGQFQSLNKQPSGINRQNITRLVPVVPDSFFAFRNKNDSEDEDSPYF